MTFRHLMIAGGMVALLLGGTQAYAQRAPRGTRMLVLVKFNPGYEAWTIGPRIASATGMQFLGVSPSTNSAVYHVTNETNYEQGTVASRNYKTISDGFPGAVFAYNYGSNYPTPADVTLQGPVDPRRDRDDMPRRGGRPGGYGSTRLSARDRLAVRDWYSANREVGSRLQPGMLLNSNLQLQSYPAPNDLVRVLPRVAAGSRYLILGNQLLLVDGRNYIEDVVQFDSGR